MGSVMVLNGQFCCFVEAVRLFCNGVRVGSCGFLPCTLAFRLRGVEQNASNSMGSDGFRRGTQDSVSAFCQGIIAFVRRFPNEFTWFPTCTIQSTLAFRLGGVDQYAS